MSWAITVIVRHYVFSLIVAARPQAIPDRVGGRNLWPFGLRLSKPHPFQVDRQLVLRQAQGERKRTALPLITRPTEHSGVTFGAATSALLTGVGEIYLRWHYKDTLTLGRSHREREDKALWYGGFGASPRARPTELQRGREDRKELSKPRKTD
jgi:hypothetical protein